MNGITTRIGVDEIPDGYYVHEAKCPTCGHEFDVLFGEGYETSCMMGLWDDFECEDCLEWFTVIRFEGGAWITYWCDGYTTRWMYAAGHKQMI